MYKDEPPEATFSNIELPHTETLILYQESYKLIRLAHQPESVSSAALTLLPPAPGPLQIATIEIAVATSSSSSSYSQQSFSLYKILQIAACISLVLIEMRQAFLVQKPHDLRCGEMQQSCHKFSDRSVKHMCT